MAATLDIENPVELREYLHGAGRIGPDEEIESRVLPGGVSCKTVLVRRRDGTAWVLKQALAKLRVRADWFSEPERIHREAAGLRRLAALAPAGAVVDFVFEDHAAHVLAMAAVPEPHENWKAMLLARGPEHDHAAQFGRLLGWIHRRAAQQAETLRAEFGDTTFFDQLRLDAYYRAAAANVPAAADFYTRLIGETLANRVTLVHGDFSPKNVLVQGGRLVLLDHEVIHWGDPAFDVGFGCTHLVAKARHRQAQGAGFVQAAQIFWQTYAQETAGLFPGLEARAVRHTLGCLLARAEGRSPLEYLAPAEREALRIDVMKLLPVESLTMAGVVSQMSRPSA
ncbi:MAG: aminoglycoside phosphotransferase family protein [Verrucomicrobia bacterium]|nr:aminoglycoside phosphotransferase family protein [Verrucomicrobiota bacterium]